MTAPTSPICAQKRPRPSSRISATWWIPRPGARPSGLRRSARPSATRSRLGTSSSGCGSSSKWSSNSSLPQARTRTGTAIGWRPASPGGRPRAYPGTASSYWWWRQMSWPTTPRPPRTSCIASPTASRSSRGWRTARTSTWAPTARIRRAWPCPPPWNQTRTPTPASRSRTRTARSGKCPT